MLISKATFGFGMRKLHVNASWITIRDNKTDEVLFDRAPPNENWYDPPHRRIVKALEELEAALNAAS